MALSAEFQEFDSVHGRVPGQPFSCLPEIASRARSILKDKTTRQIEQAAKRICHEIETYFSDLKEQAVGNLRQKFEVDPESFEDFFEWDGGTLENGRWFYKDCMDEDLDVLTAENSSEVDALKTIIEERDEGFMLSTGVPLTEYEHWPEGKTDELFAVLAIMLLTHCCKTMVNDRSAHDLSFAGDWALKAMDAVGFAEHAREVEWLKQFFEKQLTDVSIVQDLEHREMVINIRKGLEAEAKKHEHQKQLIRSERLNAARHEKTNAAKDLICREWDKDRNAFASAEKAGKHFADWLVAEGKLKSIEPRTVTAWIRSYAKDKGVKFR